MSDERVEGKERREHGAAEEKIGKEFGDKGREEFGKEEKEYGKAEEKVGKDLEKRGMTGLHGMTMEYVCATCGASFPTDTEREDHNNLVHR
jgi:uncharacterized protein YjbJ (UPF0337 family)